MDARLVKCSDDLLRATKQEWLEKAATLGDIGPYISSDVANKLDALEKEDKTSSDFHVYCLVDDKGQSRSLLQIIHALPASDSGWLKLLDITLDPILSFSNGVVTEEAARNTFTILAKSIVGSISLIFKEFRQAKSIKIYGRTDLMRSMFVSLLSSEDLNNALKPIGVQARQESTWLVFEKQ